MKLVGLPRAEELLKDYPHQLSGMRQRVMIAMALVCDPKVLIADEPTTALDVTIQAQILQLMKDLNKRLNTAVLLITHDLGVVAETCERVIVMYAGQIVEEAPIQEIFVNPKHPYTQGLIKSVPDMRYKRTIFTLYQVVYLSLVVFRKVVVLQRVANLRWTAVYKKHHLYMKQQSGINRDVFTRETGGGATCRKCY